MHPSLASIPGYADALKRERDVRDVGILNVNTRICGVEVRQMTLRDWLVLDAIDCELLGGNYMDMVEVVRFMWFMSPKFNPKSKWKRWRFTRRLGRMNAKDLSIACEKYVRDVFIDTPMTIVSKGDQWTAPLVSFAASIIHTLADFYGWSKNEIMGMTVKEIFQYMKLINIRRQAEIGEKPILANPSDEVKMKAIAEHRAKAKSNE
jgi:hypothetical protein